MKAILLKTDGEQVEITPKNGKDFKWDEIVKTIGCDLFECVYLPNNMIMLIDESGALQENRTVNRPATLIYKGICKPRQQVIDETRALKEAGFNIIDLPGNEEGYIYGNAILCSRDMVL